MRNRRHGIIPCSLVVAGCLAAWAGFASAQSIGPSTSTEPYILPSAVVAPGAVKTISIFTVGDSINGYRMVGIPDGLGAFKGREGWNGRERWGHHDRRDGTLDLLMNHELGSTQGVPRDHGSPGAFVSRWKIDRKSLAVLEGEDQIRSGNDVFLWDPLLNQHVQGTTAFNRFCSADLPASSAFFYHGLGTTHRIYLNGEETRPPFSSDHGRAFAHIVTGPNGEETWELPRLGKMSFENVVASPHPQVKTVVVLLDDAAASTSPAAPNVPSELYVYIGTKTSHGTSVDRAGLTNGNVHGMKVSVDGVAVTEESNAFGLGLASYIGTGRFTLHNFGDVSNKTGVQLQADSIAAGIFRMQRVEDGAWDPRPGHENDFYFVTTASMTTNSRLWRLRFDDSKHPELGGRIEIVLTGVEGHRMLDNITVDRRGRILMQEDVGSNARLGKIWLYDIATGTLVEVAEHNPKFFLPGPSFLTQDEESSGIIDASEILGDGWYLLDVEVHRANPDPELVEDGQLLAMFVDPDLLGSAGHDDHDGRHDWDDEREDGRNDEIYGD